MEKKPSKKNLLKNNDLEFLNKYPQDSQIFSKIAHKITKKISFGKSSINKKMSSEKNMKRKFDKLELPDSESSGPFARSGTPMSGYSSDEEYGPSASQPLIYNDAVSIQLHQPRSDMATGG